MARLRTRPMGPRFLQQVICVSIAHVLAVLLLSEMAAAQSAISHSGRKDGILFLFAARDFENPTPEGDRLYLIDQHSGQIARWSEFESPRNSVVQSLVWSSARQRLLVSAVHRIFFVDRSGQVSESSLRPLDDSATQGPFRGIQHFSWFPDGSHVVFTWNPASRKDELTQIPEGVFAQAASGGQSHRIATASRVRSPTFSSDQKSLFFAEVVDPDARRAIIYRHEISTSSRHQLAELDMLTHAGSLQASPSAPELALISKMNSRYWSLWAINQVDGSRRQIVPVGDQERKGVSGIDSFAWSPDGRKIAFRSNDQGPCQWSFQRGDFCSFHLYVVNADGTDRKRLTKDAIRMRGQIAWIELRPE